jgi:DNA-binding PadR family transcriptional regulator
MFKDHSLLPAEAVRLAALGLLAEGPRRYGDLAMEIRHFIALAVGPSLDLMGSSIELLRYEGLAAVEDETLTLTPAGAAALARLLSAPLRAPSNDASRLALLLKLRFLHHLEAAEQAAQRGQIEESLEAERARLEELRRRHATTAPALRDWLDRDIADLGARIADQDKA